MIEKLCRLAPFGFQVMVVDLRSNANFLEFDDVLILARIALLAALLIPELAIVHKTAHRWNSIRRNFDEIKSLLASHLERVTRRDDPYLVTFVIDQPDLADPDALIYARLNGSGNGRPPLRCRELFGKHA